MINEIVDIMMRSRGVAVLTGAGISAESGVPTFRGKEGLWGKFSPDELATMNAFMANPKIVWEWYNWRRNLIGEVKPNPGHYALAEFEKLLDRFTLITQNVDGLHRLAGSKNILELHGNIMRNKCLKCGRHAPDDIDIDPDNIPVCSYCGGQLRPDVVWFGEMLDPDVIAGAFEAAETCDLFLSVGTSAVVHPAASLPVAAVQRGATLVEINPDRTPLTDYADFYVPSASGVFLPKLLEAYRERTNS
ncbi:MAG TPA: NAD-dependent deacylase [candidate division Zixibacteria bacterium]|nr:NAD-dependent deacylase [candidate division Zixibacteria bacterium]